MTTVINDHNYKASVTVSVCLCTINTVANMYSVFLFCYGHELLRFHCFVPA